MKKMIIAAVTSVLLMTAAGCSTLERTNDTTIDVAVSYATLKVIERDNDISGNDVIRVMDEIDAIVGDEDVPLDGLRMKAMEVVGYDELQLSDRFLVEQVFDRVEDSIRSRLQDSTQDHSGVRIRLKELVAVIREASLMSIN